MKAGWSNLGKATAAAAAVAALWLSSSATAAAETNDVGNEPDADGGVFGQEAADERFTIVDPTARPGGDWEQAIGGYLNTLARTCGVGAHTPLAVESDDVRPVGMNKAGLVAEAFADESVRAEAEVTSEAASPADVELRDMAPAVVGRAVDLSQIVEAADVATLSAEPATDVTTPPDASPVIDGASTWADTVVDLWFNPEPQPRATDAVAEATLEFTPAEIVADADADANVVETAATALQAEATPVESEVISAKVEIELDVFESLTDEPAAQLVQPELTPAESDEVIPAPAGEQPARDEYAELLAAFGGLWAPKQEAGVDLTVAVGATGSGDQVVADEVESSPIEATPADVVAPAVDEAAVADDAPAAGAAEETGATSERHPAARAPWWQGGLGQAAWIKAVIEQCGDAPVGASARRPSFCATPPESAAKDVPIEPAPLGPELLVEAGGEIAADCATLPVPSDAQ